MFTKRNYLAAVLTRCAQAADHRVSAPDAGDTGRFDFLTRADQSLEGTWLVSVTLATPPPGFTPSFIAGVCCAGETVSCSRKGIVVNICQE